MSGSRRLDAVVRKVGEWRTPLAAGLLTLGFALSALACVLLTRQGQGIATIWAANGFLVTALLILPRRWAAGSALACFAANIAIYVSVGDPPGPTIAFALLNQLESIAAAYATRRILGPALRLSDNNKVMLLLGLALLAPCLVTSGLAAGACQYLFARPFMPVWRDWFFSDLIGLGITLPLLLLTLRPRDSRPFKVSPLEAMAEMGLLLATAVMLFGQNQVPTPFLVLVTMMLIAFRMGPRGVAWGGALITIIAMPAMLFTDGPTGMVGRELSFRLHLVQLSVLMAVYAALFVAIAVSRRARLQEMLIRRERLTRQARHRAIEASRAKTQFLATMSHEIRTPMNSIIGFTKILMDTPDLPPQVRRQLSLIDSAGASLMTVVDDILDFSKVEAGEIELCLGPTSVRHIAEDAIAMITAPAEAKGLTVKLALRGPVEQAVMADEMRLRQVLLNLMNNAVKFTAEGGVELGVRVTPGEHIDNVEFTVTDTGVGIPLDRRDRLFVRFSQVDSSVARMHGGTGLGLAICKGLVELMDGAIGVKSAPGRGSTFFFEVPLTRAEGEIAPAEAAAGRNDTAAEGLGLKVLLVDDHPMNRELGAALLTIMGCDFDLAENGEEAVEAARTTPYDAILMDVHMPGMDGLAATRQIRSMEGPAAHTPIIAMTADVLPEQVARCRAAGMDAHVSKPVRPDQLYQALADCIGAGETDVQDLVATA